MKGTVMKKLMSWVIVCGFIHSQSAFGVSQFDNMKHQYTQGKTSLIRLILNDSPVQIRNKNGAGVVKEIIYDNIESLTHSRSKHARLKSVIATVILLDKFGAPVFLLKGKNTGLLCELKDGAPVVLRLNKNNYSRVTTAFEDETGIQTNVFEY